MSWTVRSNDETPYIVAEDCTSLGIAMAYLLEEMEGMWNSPGTAAMPIKLEIVPERSVATVGKALRTYPGQIIIDNSEEV